MNIVELDNVLSSLQSVQTCGELTEELHDITADLAIDECSKKDLIPLFSNVYQHSRIVQDCSIDIERDGTSEHLFRITRRGIDLEEPTFQLLGDNTSVNGPEYERQLSTHSTHERITLLIDSLADLLIEVEQDTPYTVDCPIILDKQEIGNVILANASLNDIQSSDIDLLFWFDIELLRSWRTNHSFSEYGSRLFDQDKLPVLVYFQSTGEPVDGTSLLPVSHLDDDISVTAEGYREYQRRMSIVGDNTTFRNGAPAITPALFVSSQTLTQLFKSATVYACFSVFADRVTAVEDSFEFYTKQGPESLRSVVDIDAVAGDLTQGQIMDLCDLYQDFADREDRETFVGFWRRSAVQHCGEITDLPDVVDAIGEHYRFIEAETVEGNFDDLSDAVRDTHAFMTAITAQVGETTAALSNEIQRLVFTLLGAILANLFLILRWGNIDMVIPFSLFVIGAILVFYFPLIDRRIEELEEMKSKGEEDYSTYDDLITGFTGEAFDFSELRERKDDYMTYADQRLDWSRRILRRLHAVLLVLGIGFVILATSLYPPQSSQVVLSVVYLFALAYLTVRVYSTPESHSYYRISLPHHDPDDVDDQDDILYTNHLPSISVGISLLFILVNVFTPYLPI